MSDATAVGPVRQLLVVEDDEANRKLLQQVFAAHAVVTAASPVAARRHLETGVFDVVVVDLSMPDNGGALVAWLAEAQPEMLDRLVVLTGHSLSYAAEMLGRPGIRVLQKPVPVEELRRVVEEGWSRDER